MGLSTPQPARAIRRITLSYLLALTLVALLSTSDLILKNLTLDRAAEGATIINLSGKQRMLSQRIALFASRVRSEAQQGRDSSTSAAALSGLAEEFLDNHLALTRGDSDRGINGPLSSRSRDLYFRDGLNSLDAQVRAYAAAAAALAENPMDDSAMALFAGSVPTTLLSRLEEVVRANEEVTRAVSSSTDNLEKWFWGMTLLLLIFEAWWIFRPVTRFASKAMEKLEQEADARRTAQNELAEFGYRCSHDLIGPMVSIEGLVIAANEAIVEGDPDEAKKATSLISDSAKKAQMLLRDLSALTRLLRYESSEASSDPTAVTRNALAKVQELAEASGVQLQADLADAPAVPVASEVLSAVVHHLVENAIQYHDPTASSRQVSVQLKTAPRKVVLSVEDNGLGMSAVEISKATKLFSRFRPEHAPGSGVGLYLVQKVATMIKGDFTLSSSGTGCCAVLQMPCQPAR